MRSPNYSILLVAGMSLALLAGDALAGTCRIDWHPRGSGLLAVIKDGRPYKGKAYLAHDDVVRLREVLIAAGECQREVARERCSVRPVAGGRYQIHFGAKPLYKRETHGSTRSAGRQLTELVRVGFCEAKPQSPRQMTASTAKKRKLKLTK